MIRDALLHTQEVELADMARSVFGDGVAIAVTNPQSSNYRPHPREQAAVVDAVPKRQTEFAAGRGAARQVLLQLGVRDHPVLAAVDRSPVWPDGIVGSISHSDESCIVVAGHSRRITALGVDLEPDTALERELWDSICQPEEIEWLEAQPERQQGGLAKLIFSAKECAYKAQYSLTRTLFGFEGLTINLALSVGRFRAIFTQDVGLFRAGQGIDGGFVRHDGTILTGLRIDAAPA